MDNKIKEITSFLEGVLDPSLNQTLKELDAIKEVSVSDDDIVYIKIAISNRSKDEAQVKIAIVKYIKISLKYPGVRIDFIDLPKPLKTSKIKYIAIASGKGGVGKSSVTANLAYAMTTLGKSVGIIDADLYGASIPAIFKLPVEPLATDEDDQLIPVEKEGIEIISTEFFMPEMQPLMWRGPMLSKLLIHFFEGVVWNPDIEYILIDLPPGTGDVTLDVQEFMPSAKVVLVTTPHPNAAHVAIKAGLGAKEIGHEVMGVIENMSYYLNSQTQEKAFIFGQGGGLLAAEKLSVELLAQLPIQPVVSNETYLYGSQTMNGKLYQALALKLISKCS